METGLPLMVFFATNNGCKTLADLLAEKMTLESDISGGSDGSGGSMERILFIPERIK